MRKFEFFNAVRRLRPRDPRLSVSKPSQHHPHHFQIEPANTVAANDERRASFDAVWRRLLPQSGEGKARLPLNLDPARAQPLLPGLTDDLERPFAGQEARQDGDLLVGEAGMTVVLPLSSASSPIFATHSGESDSFSPLTALALATFEKLDWVLPGQRIVT